MNLLMNRIHVTIAKLNSTHLKNKKQSDLQGHLLVLLWLLLATWLLVAVFFFFFCARASLTSQVLNLQNCVRLTRLSCRGS